MKLTPLKMKPCYQDYLWGGSRLRTEFGKTDGPERLAESWELAAHDAGHSTVAGGELDGKTLEELGALDRAAFWGSECPAGDFPLLVKLIDAKRDLSIQVHPSNETALQERGESGKAEMWYIVDCAPQSFLYFGFSRQLMPEEFLQKAQDGTICDALNRVDVSRGDVFYILPGTIHAIGAGIVLAEIQQNSNTTFRVYDYQRLGSDGKPRALHLARAAQVMDYTPVLPEECRANSTAEFPAFTMTEMFSCDYFRAYRVDVHTAAGLRCDGRSFQHLLCVEGSGVLCASGEELSFQQGDSFFLPAAMGEYKIAGKSRLLLSRI